MLGRRLVFSATTPSLGRELYITDGTVAGTVAVDLRRGAASSNPSATYPARRFVRAGSFLFFTANDGTSGEELFRTDGTRAGTLLLKDIARGSAGSAIFGPTPLDNRVLFAADDGTSGAELWSSDGGSAGTVRVKDILPGPRGSGPLWIRAVGKRRALFSAQAVDSSGAWLGWELHLTDGSSKGTTLLADLVPGPRDALPRGFTMVGNTVFFAAVGKNIGLELFAMDMTGISRRYGSGCASSGDLPVLDTTDPRLNRYQPVWIENAAPNKAGMVLVGLRAHSQRRMSRGGGCDILLDLGGPFLPLPLRTSAVGRWSYSQRIPNDVRLLGLEIAMQAVVGPTATGPLGADLTNLTLLVPGR